MAEEQIKDQEGQQEPKAAEPQEEPKAEPKVDPLKQELEGLRNDLKSIKESEEQKNSALQQHIQKQQQEAIDFFKDDQKKRALLATMNKQEADSLLEDIEKGNVTRRELEVRAELGFAKITGPKEATTVPVSKPQQSVSGNSFDDISGQLLQIQRNPNHPYHNPSHPEHVKAVAQYEKLDKQRENLVS